jgi:hypothetical protein
MNVLNAFAVCRIVIGLDVLNCLKLSICPCSYGDIVTACHELQIDRYQNHYS